MMIEFFGLVIFSIGVGILASMVGISGGAFRTPVLIIMIGLGAELAAASSLLSAFFVAIVCSVVYYRKDSRLICYQVSLLFVMTTIPGAFVGVTLRTVVADTELLRLVFGIILFPIAMKLLLSVPTGSNQDNSEKCAPIFNQLNKRKVLIAIFAAFFAGVLAGFLGIGGGTIIVPVLCILLEFPAVAAAATSMFTMIFTSSAGSIMNYTVLAPSESMTVFLYYGVIMGIGMTIGGLIGPRYAYRVNTDQLQRFFGFILIFPIVKMMRLGFLWLDPSGLDYILEIIGDTIIWLLIGVPTWLFSSFYQKQRRLNGMQKKENIANQTIE
ncbi:MAG: sulfite exporter TauE/SafE family protein [Candidatus Thorarchaeota archaeon]